MIFFFFKQKTAYEIKECDWSSDVCSSDLFVFLYVKMTKAGNDFINFMIQIPVVISGKKSLVGPKDNSYYKNLYIGKCGLTGLWYTELYNRQDVEEINKMNLFYAKNQNIWLDLEILGKTFAKMFIKSE